ncbi:MAG: mechanosensitive ion channel protein MscS [Omnitrophica WOR_2 bacterium SM23_29]|nr:MAG: mechanosensitive ion channel protein MscS [Omnitrophica WOR_2 bacterium SM23_29]
MVKVFLGNTMADYLLCMLLILLGFIIVKVFQVFLLKRLKAWAKKTDTTIDDFLVGLISKIALPFLYFSVFFLSLNALFLNLRLKKAIDVVWVAVLTLSAIRLAIALIKYGLDVYWIKMGKQEPLKRSLHGILVISKVVIWGLALVFFLDNLGFKISAVIAGLGIGGVAVALAAQAVLGDLFSYFAILFDRPFEIGDFIIIGDYMGIVEHVGIKTTRIRSLGGEQLVFSNTDLTNSRVRNYKRMEKRRVVFKLGVTYQTPLEKLKIIPGIIENTIKNVKDTTFDRAHFFSYGDFSLIFEIVYYVTGADYNKYMDIQQEINFAIKKEFESRDIEFAYPTQTVFVTRQ